MRICLESWRFIENVYSNLPTKTKEQEGTYLRNGSTSLVHPTLLVSISDKASFTILCIPATKNGLFVEKVTYHSNKKTSISDNISTEKVSL